MHYTNSLANFGGKNNVILSPTDMTDHVQSTERECWNFKYRLLSEWEERGGEGEGRMGDLWILLYFIYNCVFFSVQVPSLYTHLFQVLQFPKSGLSRRLWKKWGRESHFVSVLLGQKWNLFLGIDMPYSTSKARHLQHFFLLILKHPSCLHCFTPFSFSKFSSLSVPSWQCRDALHPGTTAWFFQTKWRC